MGGTFAFFLFYKPIYLSRGQLVLDSVIIAILEATATSVDNLVLPLYSPALALCAVAVDRSRQFPLAGCSTTFNFCCFTHPWSPESPIVIFRPRLS